MTGSLLASIFGAQPSLADSLRGAEKVAASSAPVLVLGEPGSGRSTLARALHDASARRSASLVEVDPGSIPSSLFESEFFGHEAGAFTGAESSRQGRVAAADGGSLLLDHVEELPLSSQPKLLRLLSERRYVPLGGREAGADVRFISVAAEDLRSRVAAGTFREDLYYRLEVMTLRIPPLRERLEDLPTLIDMFRRDLGQRFGLADDGLSAAAREWMLDHRWPGNLRELRNVLERAMVLAGGGVLDPPRPRGAESRPRTLAELEREQILSALAYTRGHQTRAAEILGISRKALWEKRKRWGLP